MNKAEQVHDLMRECLNGSPEGGLVMEGVVRNFVFSLDKISEHREEIRALLNEMPPNFHKDTGGGWSFLRLCVDKDGEQWAEHNTMEELVCLGMAAGMVKYSLPRKMWSVLPGGMPYVTFDTRI